MREGRAHVEVRAAASGLLSGGIGFVLDMGDPVGMSLPPEALWPALALIYAAAVARLFGDEWLLVGSTVAFLTAGTAFDKRGAWDGGARANRHEATKSTRPAVPKGPVCMCVHIRADVREAGTSQVPWVRWETGHKSQGASCLPCWVGRTDDPTAATGRRAHENARPDGGFQAGAMNCAPGLTTGRGEGA